MAKFLVVRAVGEGADAFSCPRPGGPKNGARFFGRDRAGAVLPDGERVADGYHVRDLIAQGHLELVSEE